MKKALSFLIVFLLSFCVIVNAESSAEISSIEIDSKSDEVEEIDEASFENLNINLSVRVYEKDDYIKYKIIVKNLSDEEITLDNSSLGLKDSDYITYDISGDTTLKANSNGIIYLTITYANAKAAEDTCTTYTEDQSLNIGYLLNLSNNEENPNTNAGTTLSIILIVFATSSIIFIILNKNKYFNKYIAMFITILGISSIIAPFIVQAESNNKINITVNVEIGCKNFTMFKEGNYVRYIMNVLSGGSDSCEYEEIPDSEKEILGIDNDYVYFCSSEDIFKIEYDSEIPESGYEIVSTDESEYPIYMWYKNHIIYYSSEANEIYLNPDSSMMYSELFEVKSIDFTKINTSKVKYMFAMFDNSNQLTALDLSTFDTSSVTNMNGMFAYMKSLENLNVSSFNTTNVNTMGSMFEDCESLTKLNLSSFDTSNVVYMGAMFRKCSSLIELDLSSFDTSSVTDMGWMFYEDTNLKKLKISNFDTSSVTYMKNMFNGCETLTELNISNFDTSKVINMEGMFSGCSSLTELDLSSFDTSLVTDMYEIFQSCNNLKTIYVSEKFVTEKAFNHTYTGTLFNECASLIGGNGTKYNSNNDDQEYARIDTDSTPGYFTLKS